MEMENSINTSQDQMMMDYPEELIIAIQLHFGSKIPREIIRESLYENNNDLFLCLKDIHQKLYGNSHFTEE